MANYNFTFDEIVKYAESLGWKHRGEPSRAKDYTKTFWQTPYGEVIMALYEGERRTLRGHDKPEVCWICIHSDGSVSSLPSRYFQRYMTEKRGFRFSEYGKQTLADFYNNEGGNNNVEVEIEEEVV